MGTEHAAQAISMAAVKSALSDQRLKTYRFDEHEADEIVLARYRWNLALGRSFYPSIGLLEVTLRNNLHRVISEFYKTPRWYEQDPPVLREIERDAILKAKVQLQNNRKPEEPDRLIAELSFGFWTGLLGTDYEQQIWHRNGNLAKAFPHIPKKCRTRANIERKLQIIRKFRNRISHHEPIFKMDSLKDISDDVHELLRWLSPAILSMLPVDEGFDDVYARGPESYLLPIKQVDSRAVP